MNLVWAGNVHQTILAIYGCFHGLIDKGVVKSDKKISFGYFRDGDKLVIMALDPEEHCNYKELPFCAVKVADLTDRDKEYLAAYVCELEPSEEGGEDQCEPSG